MSKIRIQVHIEKENREHIARLAKKLDLKEPEVVRRLINMGLDDALLLEKSGFISFVMKAGEMMNKLKKHLLFEGKKELSMEDLKDV